MANVKPLVVGTVVGSDAQDIREHADSNTLLVGAGIADPTGTLITRVGGVPSSNGEPLDSTLQRTTDKKIPANSPRGIPLYQDARQTAVDVLAQYEGLWSVGTRTSGVEGSPELLSVQYQTTVTGSYTGTTGTWPITADAIMSGTGWTARLESITGSASSGTFVLSVYSGTVVADTTLTWSGGSLTGVTITASHVGRTTYYTDVSGRRAPKINGGSFYNVIGPGPDVLSGGAGYLNRFPLLPVYYNRGFRLPKGGFDDGAKLEIEGMGTFKNTVPSGESPVFVLALAIGHNIFQFSSLQGNNFDKVTRFTSPVLPTISVETAFRFKIEAMASRKLDRTPGQIIVCTLQFPSSVWGGSGIWTGTLQRGSDHPSAPTTYLAYDGIVGEDATNKRDLKYGSVWMGVFPEVAASGECYANVHALQVRLIKGTR